MIGFDPVVRVLLHYVVRGAACTVLTGLPEALTLRAGLWYCDAYLILVFCVVVGQWRMPNRVRVLEVSDSDRGGVGAAGSRPWCGGSGCSIGSDCVAVHRGLSGPDIADRVGCTEPTVVLWRRRYAEEGLAGLDDRPRKPPLATTVTEEVRDEILSVTLSRPPAELGITPWSSWL
jgi:hypothetical protein